MIKVNRIVHTIEIIFIESLNSYNAQLVEINKQICIEKNGKEKCEQTQRCNDPNTGGVNQCFTYVGNVLLNKDI